MQLCLNTLFLLDQFGCGKFTSNYFWVELSSNAKKIYKLYYENIEILDMFLLYFKLHVIKIRASSANHIRSQT